ncbi:MAG: PD-(D/E)XK nuclease family protein [Epsilonproteobacteria bacterium]|nr:MAG: PD-(D/E)XK nuclease family protein [Campylobacterota bacterium]
MPTNIKKTLLVYPTSRAIREYISTFRSSNIFLPKIISIGDFFQRAIYTPNKKIISMELKTIYLQQVVQDIDIKALGISSDFSSFIKQSEYIFRFFNELASEFKTIDDLGSADTYAHYLDHLDILRAIQTNYHKLLEKYNFIDQSLLPTNYRINTDYLEQFDNIRIIHEGIFSGYELKVIADISEIMDLDVEYKEKTPIQDYNISITPISQKLLQVAFIKQKIYEMISIDRINPSKIVVLLPDESFHESLMLFDNEKYFNFAMGNNISQSKIVQVVKIINKVLINYEPKDKDKRELFNINKVLFDDLIEPNWNIPVSKNIFIEIFDGLILHENDEDIIEKLNELKISLTILFFTNDLDLKLKDMFKIIQNKLNEISVDDTHGGKITVLGLLETRAVSFDGVIVVDFNDEKIPKRSIKDKFLSSKVKEICGLPTSKQREDLQKYYYKNLFDRAKKIAVCYVDSDEGSRSRFISEIFPNTKEDKKRYDFSKILYTSNSNSLYKSDIIQQIDLSKRSWSATSLKSYLQCKRMFYFNYIAKIKEHDISLKPKGYELGNIVHEVLEKLLKKDNLTLSTLKNELSSYQTTNPYLTMELEIWKQKLIKFIKVEDERKENGIKVFELEKEFSFEYNNIRLKGTIDRIDKLANGNYEILDYKTSSNLKIDTAKTYEKSNDFQLEFYALSQRDKMIDGVSYYDLNDATIKSEVMLNEKIKLLDLHLRALNTTEVNFKLCEDKVQCTYCIYKIMCGRE